MITTGGEALWDPQSAPRKYAAGGTCGSHNRRRVKPPASTRTFPHPHLTLSPQGRGSKFVGTGKMPRQTCQRFGLLNCQPGLNVSEYPRDSESSEQVAARREMAPGVGLLLRPGD